MKTNRTTSNTRTARSPRFYLILAAIVLMSLVLAACGAQAPKGTLYVASKGAKTATVVRMTSVKSCDIESGTIAYAYRETYFDAYVGAGQTERTSLTQIYHNGSGCTDGAYDFIQGTPSDTGWTEIKSGTPAWVNAAKVLCKLDRGTKPDDLNEICKSLQ